MLFKSYVGGYCITMLSIGRGPSHYSEMTEKVTNCVTLSDTSPHLVMSHMLCPYVMEVRR